MLRTLACFLSNQAFSDSLQASVVEVRSFWTPVTSPRQWLRLSATCRKDVGNFKPANHHLAQVGEFAGAQTGIAMNNRPFSSVQSGFMNTLVRALLVAALAVAATAAEPAFHPAACEGAYPRHIQGICTNGRDAIYWSWTETLVKTDRDGRILKQVPVANHHGDLCHHAGRVYVAVNLGKFNEPAGAEDSWVYVYDGDTLAELARHRVPELVHGAGGMEWRDGKFFIIGGLPPGVNENYIYEYDENFRFLKRHVLASGYTLMGIQTVTYADGAWWFGCYGKPAVLLRADEKFQLTAKWEFNAAVGIAPIGDGRFLIAHNTALKGDDGKVKSNRGRVGIARADAKAGMVIEKP